MWVLVNLVMLVVASVFAGAAAVAVYWLMLRATLELMRPAAVRTVPAGLAGPHTLYARSTRGAAKSDARVSVIALV